MLNKEMCQNALSELVFHAYNDAIMNGDVLSDEFEKTLEKIIQEHFELVEAIDWLKEEITEPVFNMIFGSREFFRCWYKGIMIINTENHVLTRKLADYENPQPYKFEDLKEGLWVWDRKENKCNKIIEINNDKIEFYYVIDNASRFTCEFEENRFFPVQMANKECD